MILNLIRFFFSSRPWFLSRAAEPGLLWSVLLLSACCFATASQAELPPQSPEPPVSPPWVLRPYQVEVQITCRPAATLPVSICKTWTQSLQAHLAARYGQMWNMRVSLESSGTLIASLGDLSSATANEIWGEESVDKVFRIIMEERGGTLVIAGREWDQSSQSLGNQHQRLISDRRDTAGELAALIQELFRPLVEIDVIEPGRTECLVRAGELAPPEGPDAPFQSGMFLVPFLRYFDQHQKLQRLQTIPWTYLEVDRVQRARLTLKQHSAFRTPLPVLRRRVQVLAMHITSDSPATEILIFPRGQIQNPLVGIRCLISPQSPPPVGPQQPPIEFATDRRGILTLPAPPDVRLQSLQVYSGTALLARVPVFPGTAATLQLETPDDRARLEVEGEVQLLESELVEIVATREVLITRTNAAVDQKRWDDVDRFLKDLQRLPSQQQLFMKIDQLQLVAVQAAQNAGDRVAEARMMRLCDSIRNSVTKYLEPSRINEFIREIRSQRLKQETTQPANS